jgi:hypothetical protein
MPNFANCYAKALADAVRAAALPQLTEIYIRTHGSQEAASRGIEIPVLAATK